MKKIVIAALALATTTAALSTFGHTSLASPRPSKPIRLTDDAHHTITLHHLARRIVTIEPSNAEIALTLGLKSSMVGADQTTFTYIPAPWKQEIKGVPNIGASYPAINVEKIVAAKPDLVIASQGEKGISSLAHFHIPVLILEPTSIQGMYHDMLLVGKATGKTQVAKTLIQKYRRQIAAIEKSVSRATTRPTVFYDLGGLYTVGPNTFLNALINMAGARNVGATMSKEPWPAVTAEQVVQANPDVILIDSSAGTSISKEEQVSGFSAIRAVKSGHVYELSNSSYVVEPSPALIRGLKELVGILHPAIKTGK